MRRVDLPQARPRRIAVRRPRCILVVSQDPFFIEQVRSAVDGVRVIACLGPAASPCILDTEDVCPLAATSAVVLVDSPPSGVFRRHLREIQAGDYAERVQAAHPQSLVVLVAGPGAPLGPTGAVTIAGDRDGALQLLKKALLTRTRKSDPNGTGGAS